MVVNENLRGQPFNLFIEDAIQETTTTTSGVSAEYGRFSGGVVNTITKSGGNEISGSFRTNFTNNKWEAETPLTAAQADDINQRYEATLGGWLLRDRLWYFAVILPRRVDDMLAQWMAREDRSSWCAHKIRQAMISRLGAEMSSNMPLLRVLVPMSPLLGLILFELLAHFHGEIVHVGVPTELQRDFGLARARNRMHFLQSAQNADRFFHRSSFTRWCSRKSTLNQPCRSSVSSCPSRFIWIVLRPRTKPAARE